MNLARPPAEIAPEAANLRQVIQHRMREPGQCVTIEFSMAIDVFHLDVFPALELPTRQSRQLRIGNPGVFRELAQGQLFSFAPGIQSLT